MGFEIQLTINAPVTTLSGISIPTGAFIQADEKYQVLDEAGTSWYFSPYFYNSQADYTAGKSALGLEGINRMYTDPPSVEFDKEYIVAVAGASDVDTVEKCKLLVANAIATDLGIDPALIS